VAIVRKALARERLTFDGEFFTLPLPDGPGKALTLTVHPVRERIPIYLAAVGPRNLELAGEIADGWLAIFFDPDHSDELLGHIRTGREKAGLGIDGFDIVPTVPVIIGDDIEACAEPVRAYCALYIGGMGSREKNFYNALAVRMGFGDAAARIQDLYLAKDYAGAAAAVPLEFIQRTSLIGPPDVIVERLKAYAAAGVSTLTLASYHGTLEDRLEQLRLMPELLAQAGLAEA
jgi:alkanesulfonate monooxygenase SsuD/methylene tetrahydromethanopterin reductase-like flavin-dependent oxidoreductase (luciferase family)